MKTKKARRQRRRAAGEYPASGSSSSDRDGVQAHAEAERRCVQQLALGRNGGTLDGRTDEADRSEHQPAEPDRDEAGFAGGGRSTFMVEADGSIEPHARTRALELRCGVVVRMHR